MKTVRRCTRCIMDDSSDSTIEFDENGVCNYCKEALARKAKEYFPNEEGQKKIDAMIDRLKRDGKGKKYDCIMGLSGGLDSSYLAYLGHQWGLRVLAVHIDDGYDTEISKENLRKLVEKTGFDYEVVRPDKEQFNQLTLAYMKAGVPNIATPQDNVLFAFLFKKMKEYKIKYFLTGGNYSLECILQRGNTHKASDVVNLKEINKKFGTLPIDKLKFSSTMDQIIQRRMQSIVIIPPLNYVKYERDLAFKELEEYCGFEYYGRKHLENILTAFVQLYWFPKKFGVDKRTSHLSSMIVSDQMTREEALKEFKQPLYDVELMDSYKDIICDNMHITRDELEELVASEGHQHDEYKTEDDTLLYKLMMLAVRIKNGKK